MGNIVNPYRYETISVPNGLLDDLSIYYKLDESSGTVFDSISIYDGTVTGATYGVPGRINTAISFDGSGDYITLGNIPVPAAFSVSAWFKCSDVSSLRSIVGKSDLSGIGPGANWSLRLQNSTGYINSYVKTGASTYDEFTGNINYADGNWHNVVLTFDGNYHKCYVDGVNVYTSTALGGATQTSSTIVYIGKSAHPFVFQYMNGVIDEVGFWIDIITEEQVLKLWNGGSGLPLVQFDYLNNTFLDNLESYYKLNEITGALLDSHGVRDSTSGSLSGCYGAVGIEGDAIDLERNNSNYAGFGTWTGFGSGNISISAWFKIESFSGSAMRIICFPHDDGTTDTPALYFGIHSTGNLISAGCGGSPYDGYVFTSSAPTLTTWYHILVVRSTKTTTLYLNGVLIGTATSTGTVSTNPLFYIGRYNANYGQYFDGIVDEVSIWTGRILTNKDAIGLYNGGEGLFYDSFEEAVPPPIDPF